MKTLYIDMDNVLVDFMSGVNRLDDDATRQRFSGHWDEVPEVFAVMDPQPGAIESFHTLAGLFDTYILSTAPWLNATAWSDKVLWVHRHLGEAEGSPAYKRLILSHHKNLNDGDFLIDDRLHNGVDRFGGEHVHFGQGALTTWQAVTDYLVERA